MIDADHSGDAAAGGPPAATFCLPSRARARDACLRGVAAGVVLLTGEAGSGKTWLWRGLADEGASGLVWLAVDVTPSTDPIDLTRAIVRSLGLVPPEDHRAGREVVADVLWESNREGRGHVLVLDELHNATNLLLEEVRVLSNGVGRPDGLAGLVLCGQTALARRLRGRALTGLDARIGTRVHLPPIDFHEVTEWLRVGWPELVLDASEIEERHRWSRGNARRLIQGLRYPAPKRPLDLGLVRVRAESPQVNGPVIGPVVPSRPPVQVGDGVVEVGWDSGPEASPTDQVSELEAARSTEPPFHVAPQPALPVEETIHDPYASLQAWEEWTSGRDEDQRTIDATAAARPERRPLSGRPTHVWAEPEQGHSPYSDLFRRSRSQSDPE
jgi:hypothetical protein